MCEFKKINTCQHTNRYPYYSIPEIDTCTTVFVRDTTNTGLKKRYLGPFVVVGRNETSVIIKKLDGTTDQINKVYCKPAFVQINQPPSNQAIGIRREDYNLLEDQRLNKSD